MNASYYNAGPGERMVDEMFLECDTAREWEDYYLERAAQEWEDLRESLKTEHPRHENDLSGEEVEVILEELQAETEDDIDDAYDRDREDDYEGEEDFD